MVASPTFPGVPIAETGSGSRTITGVATSITALVGHVTSGPLDQEVALTSLADYERRFGGGTPLFDAARLFFANGGTSAIMVGVSAATSAALIGTASAKTGLYALDSVDLFNLLALPDPEADATVQIAAARYCEARRAFALLDAPASCGDAASVLQWLQQHGALRSRNAALFFPRIVAGGANLAAAPAMAGLYARNDAARGVWKAAAGLDATVLGINGFTLHLGDADAASLNRGGVDALRVFPGKGPLLWGA